MRNFELKMNGDFSLPLEQIPEHTLTYQVLVEFKSGFEVDKTEVTFMLGEESKGALIKNVTYDL